MDFSSRICIPCDFFLQIFTVQMFMTYVMTIKITRFSHVVGEQFSVTCFTISFVVIIIFVTKIIYSTVILRKIELNIVHQPPGMTSTMKFAYVIFSTMKTKGPPLFLFFWDIWYTHISDKFSFLQLVQCLSLIWEKFAQSKKETQDNCIQRNISFFVLQCVLKFACLHPEQSIRTSCCKTCLSIDNLLLPKFGWIHIIN